jgi:SAM-dependent methyltransferase
MLGMRLNRSQGRAPRAKPGIAVGVMKCEQCGLIFANPLPIPADISDHYGLSPEDYWVPEYFGDDPDYFAAQVTTAKKLVGFQPGMKALDIGAGMGKAMKALKAGGFDAYGIEASKSFRDAAIARMGIDPDRIRLCQMEKAEFGPEFDFITFGAVLEHLYHPAEALERALSWLAPGGVIQVEVPSSSHLLPPLLNLYFRLAGTNYVTHISPMHPPFHLYEFGLKSFQAHGERAGYRVVEHEFHENEVLFVPIPRIFHRPLSSWMRRKNRGMQLTVWLGKA